MEAAYGTRAPGLIQDAISRPARAWCVSRRPCTDASRHPYIHAPRKKCACIRAGAHPHMRASPLARASERTSRVRVMLSDVFLM
eukprot:70022-Chlamydomonas_euryale.AAC.1